MPTPAAGPLPEIPANHIPIAQEIIYRTLVLPAIRSQFSRVRLQIDGPVPHPADGPLIIYLTHTAWWDAYMLFLLSYKVLNSAFQNYILMEAKQLRAYRFFAWCGAFSIDRTIPGDAERSIGYIAGRLRERRARCLWIFPQGRIVPNDQRPLVIYPGIARIVQEAGGATLWPVALRYEFRGEQQPEAFIRCGPLHYAAADQSEASIIEQVREHLTGLADEVRDDILSERMDRFQILVRGRQGIDRMFDRMLAFVRGRRGQTMR